MALLRRVEWCLSTEKEEEGNFHQRRCCVEANRQLDREKVEDRRWDKGVANGNVLKV